MSEEKKAKPEKGKKEKAKTGKKGNGRVKLILFALIAAGILVPAAGLVALVGMIPSIVMYVTDATRGKSLSACVAPLNAAGVLQCMITLGQRGFSLENGKGMLMQPQNLIIMWGAAALGLGLFTFVPPIVAQALAAFAEVKIGKLRSNQKELKRIWGDEVGS